MVQTIPELIASQACFNIHDTLNPVHADSALQNDITAIPNS